MNLYLHIVQPLVFVTLMMAACVAKSGQETWGGDLAALKFVKSAQFLYLEMSSNPKCLLGQYVKKSNFLNHINTVEVQSVVVGKASEPGKIFFNRLKWWPLSMDLKAEIVLRAYFEQMGIVISSKQMSILVESCLNSELFKFNKNLDQPQLTLSRLAVEADAMKQLNELSVYLKNGRIKTLPANFQIESFEALINKIKPNKNTLNNIIESNLNAIPFGDQTVKDALNLKSETELRIIINRSAWRSASAGQKKELLLHEMLGLMGIVEKNYQYSSQLFRYLNPEEYAH